MKNKTQIIIFALTALLLPSVELQAIEIRQDLYEFQSKITRKVTYITFVLTDTPAMKRSSTQIYNLPGIHFELGSSALSSKAAQILLDNMQRYGITHDTPLFITGYACEIGSEQYNLLLSMQRAVMVVNFLKSQGFTVVALQAKGEADPIATNPEELFKNRRVEIRTE
ncbi:OmpA family protein [Desulfoprunum benzoelyticum]|jgi:outer membrane protein OmpA-like peptidoglycan-associated protein|uniref:Outer membrane protein OmpA-like peptidoglycan-associated protein n=1 Tax=Desulfoprunum benzoelyticum TaxID=1506996 RepID=A0A840URL9_9BACT|nr:OmpA family protein [Desulfoprunum benzoelyticum]MBB5348432.1 outer membrane protein OmpA-like peptidoglycan-associated protein [Desulfoprunum benzoelyticum]MBM9528710.1 OmpA family protein [Desulfoprunum benzoelyticum]